MRTMSPDELAEMLDLHAAHLETGSGESADFSHSDLAGIDLKGRELARANLHGSRLTGADFRDAGLENANFFEADLTQADLRGARLAGTNFIQARLNGADLSGTDLRSARLHGTLFLDTNLSGADLSQQNLAWCDFTGASLASAKLTGATMNRVSFRNADLRHAQVDCAGAEGGDFAAADLTCAVLADTNFTGANLFGASLAGAIIDRANLRQVRIDGETRRRSGSSAKTMVQLADAHAWLTPECMAELELLEREVINCQLEPLQKRSNDQPWAVYMVNNSRFTLIDIGGADGRTTLSPGERIRMGQWWEEAIWDTFYSSADFRSDFTAKDRRYRLRTF